MLGRLALLLASVLVACVGHRGDAWQHAHPRPPATGGATLVLLGDAGAPGRIAGKVAKRLRTTLAEEEARGRKPVVLWLGNNILAERGDRACASAEGAWAREGVADLAAAVKGRLSFAIPGEAEWRCGLVDSMRSAANPWEMPAAHYVVRLGRDGTHRVVLSCSASGCERAQGPDDPIADLVFVDIVPWIQTRATAAQQPALAALDRLAEALADPAGAPRILVSHYPIEAAGWHGLGGGDPDSTIHHWPPNMRDAIERGAFVGALASHDRSSYATADLSSATMRSDRVWLERPMFQVVSGTASRPDALAGSAYRRVRYATSITHVPPVYTPRAGFALVRVGSGDPEVELHAGKGRSWQTARLRVSVQPPKTGELVHAPPMQPCLRCDEKPASERP